MTDNRDLRAGNAEREGVMEALHQAYADGRLTDAELAERTDATGSARTFGDLDDIVADLPITPPSQEYAPASPESSSALEPQAPQAAPWPQMAHGPVGTSPEKPLVLDGGFTSAKRAGHWEVPQFLRVRGGMGYVTVDCTEATTVHQVIHLWIDGDMGSITIIVPEGWAADAEGLRKSWGSVNVKVPSEPTMGRPVLVINGSMGAGSFTVRPPNWFERRHLEKKLR